MAKQNLQDQQKFGWPLKRGRRNVKYYLRSKGKVRSYWLYYYIFIRNYPWCKHYMKVHQCSLSPLLLVS